MISEINKVKMPAFQILWNKFMIFFLIYKQVGNSKDDNGIVEDHIENVNVENYKEP